MDKAINIQGFLFDEGFEVDIKIDPSLPAFAQITYLELIKQIISKQQKSLAEKAKDESLRQLDLTEDRTEEVIEGFQSSDNHEPSYPFSLDDLPY